jgi:hypothetical protein
MALRTYTTRIFALTIIRRIFALVYCMGYSRAILYGPGRGTSTGSFELRLLGLAPRVMVYVDIKSFAHIRQSQAVTRRLERT